MKTKTSIYLLPLFLLTFSIPLTSQLSKVMTYNIRYNSPNDGLNKWDNRKEELANLISYYRPDILGIQEGTLTQLEYLDDQLSSFSRIGVGRDDGKEKGEFSPIYYNHEKLSLINESTFWLSPTPDNVSVGWNASMERICTYGLFQIKKTNQKVYIFNTHYDHIGQLAREKSSELILRKIKKINTDNYPIVLMGDFNSVKTDQSIETILKEFDDAVDRVENGIYGPIGTFTGFKKGAIPERRIDFIFVKGFSKIKSYRHIDDKMKNNNYVSDHLPVMVKIN